MVYIICAMLVLLAASYAYIRKKRERQLAYINTYQFPDRLTKTLKEKYPHLTERDINKVITGLRKYFIYCSKAKRRMVSMPSQAVDIAWHEFILFTRNYESFCKQAIGHFLHHTPTEAMRSPTQAGEGIKRAWRLACADENIVPSSPGRLPLLFAIDTKLEIDDGFTYSLECEDKTSPLYGDGYCAGHIGCASGCAGDSGSDSDGGGFFDNFGFSGDCGGSSDCGGGCGGD